MSKARLVITAVVLEGRSPSEVAREFSVARSWVYELVARYRAIVWSGAKETAELYWQQLSEAGLTMAPLEQG